MDTLRIVDPLLLVFVLSLFVMIGAFFWPSMAGGQDGESRGRPGLKPRAPGPQTCLPHGWDSKAWDGCQQSAIRAVETTCSADYEARFVRADERLRRF
jgi:hypothetical protein